MKKKSGKSSDDTDDMATDWPMIGSYTTEDGLFVKVYKAAYAAAGSNPFNVKPKKLMI